MKIAKISDYAILDIWQRRNNSFKKFLSGRLVISVQESIHMIDLGKIIYLSADSNYTQIYLEDGTFILSSKTLKHYELALLDRGFLRVHAGYLINLNKMTGITKEDGYYVTLDSGDRIPISRAFKSQLFSGNL